MHRYKSTSGKASGVTGYQAGESFILVEFNNGPVYKYSYASCGPKQVETMKKLAVNQLGLSTYISRNQPDYES